MNLNLEKGFLYLIKGGIFIVPFIPLYIANNMFFPFITGKAFIFRIIVELVFAAWILLVIFYKRYQPNRNSILIAIGLFVLIVSLASIFGVNPVKSFWSNFERMEGLVTYLHLFAYFLVLGNVFQKKDWFILFNLFILGGLAENIYALFQKMGYIASPQGGFRVDGTIGNPTYLAAYLIFVLGFGLYLLITSKNKILKIFYGLSSFFTLLIIYFTASRGPALGILAGVIMGALLYLFIKKPESQEGKSYKKIIVIGLSAVIVVIVGLWLLRDASFIKNDLVLSRFTSLSFTERTITSRFDIWKMSLKGIKDKPILGYGPENYSAVFAKYYDPALWNQETWFDRSHNIVLDWLINAGILGLLSYLGMFVAAYYLIWKNYRNNRMPAELSVLFSVLLFVYFFQNIFVFDNIATYIGFFTVLAFIYSVAEEDKKNIVEKTNITFEDILIAGGVILIPLLVTVYFINVKPLSVNIFLSNALENQGTLQALPRAAGYFENAISKDIYLGQQEVSEQLTMFAMGVNGVSQVGQDFKTKVLEMATREGEKDVKNQPLEPRAYMFLAGVYSDRGMNKEAEEIFNKALALSPKKQQIYFMLADLYIKQENYKKAVEVSEKAFDLSPAYPAGRMGLVVSYILNNQQNKADALLVEAYGTTRVADDLLVKVYSIKKDYQRMLGVRQAFVEKDPENFEYHRNLASVYLVLGDKTNAIKELEEAIRLNPQFKQEGESYIESIRK